MVKRTIIMIALVLVLCQIGYTQTPKKWLLVSKNNGGVELARISEIESATFIECIDIDGNNYEIVKIGTQIWMAENLRVTKYRDGTTDINVGTNIDSWVYNDNANNELDTYGRLYSWHAVNTGNLAPDGWHVPEDDEWIILEEHLGMTNANSTGWRGTNEGSKLAGRADLWNVGTLETNAVFGTSGFAALPAGIRGGYSGNFIGMGNDTNFWSATDDNPGNAPRWYLSYNSSGIYRGSIGKGNGYSVRCVKDAD